MKTLIIIASMIIASRVSSEDLKKLFKEDRMFELREQLTMAKDLPKRERLYYTVYLDNAFGRPVESNRAIDTLVEKYSKKLGKKKIAELMTVKSNNHIKLFEYHEAVVALKEALKIRPNASDNKDIKNSIELWSALKNVPKQKVHHSCETVVPIFKNQFNHQLIPVSVGGDTIQFVFDSGANLSTIRSGVAQRLGVIFTGSTIDVGNSVGSTVKAEYGYIPKLSIGNLVVENVVVLVMPDEKLTFTQINYTIDGIIGFPVIQELGEFAMTKDDRLIIAAQNSDVVEQNLFTKGLTPYVKVDFKGEMLTMLFDTGAVRTHISKRYYDKHKKWIKQNSMIEKSTIAGAGKSKKLKNRGLENVELQIAKSVVKLPKVEVQRINTFKDKNNDGFLGQDAMIQPREMVVNLRDMYIFFRD